MRSIGYINAVLDQIDPGVRDLVEQSIAGGVYHQTREGAAAMLCDDMDEATTTATLQLDQFPDGILIDDLVAARRETEPEKINEAAQEFIGAMSCAITNYPVDTKCAVLQKQLWAAKKLNSFTMANRRLPCSAV